MMRAMNVYEFKFENNFESFYYKCDIFNESFTFCAQQISELSIISFVYYAIRNIN